MSDLRDRVECRKCIYNDPKNDSYCKKMVGVKIETRLEDYMPGSVIYCTYDENKDGTCQYFDTSTLSTKVKDMIGKMFIPKIVINK